MALISMFGIGGDARRFGLRWIGGLLRARGPPGGGSGGGGGGVGCGGTRSEPDPNAPATVSSIEIINRLLAAGVDVNPEMNFHRPNAPGRGRFADNQVSTGTTALFRAVQLNDVEVVQLLLDKGANPNINSMGYTPFGLVAGAGPNGRGAQGTR